MVFHGFPWFSMVFHDFQAMSSGETVKTWLPSGELTVCYGKIHHAINGKIHYFYGHFQLLCKRSPEGKKCQESIRNRWFSMVFHDFQAMSSGETVKTWLPSGELTVCYGKIQNAINGKIHYFYGHFQLLCKRSPEGKKCQETIRNRWFSMVFHGFPWLSGHEFWWNGQNVVTLWWTNSLLWKDPPCY